MIPRKIEEAMVYEHLPEKPEMLHKGTAGKLYIVAGSRSFQGAAVLALKGALRSGCGYVTLASTNTVCQTACHHLLTPTYTVLPENESGRISSSASELILNQLETYDTLALGCGLGMDDDTKELVKNILLKYHGPVVLDADGINAVSPNIKILKEAKGRIIITPHEGEMSRLTGMPIEEIHASRAAIAVRFAEQYNVTVVLKGPETVVAAPDGRALKNSTGNSGLAKGGSGDLLTGIISSIAAQGIEPFWAAVDGVWIHGKASDFTAKRLSKYYMQPDDILNDFPKIFLDQKYLKKG